MAKTNKIAITQDLPTPSNRFPSVHMEVNRFEDAILKHGYNVYHYKALRCPCVNVGTGTALPDCENCRGIGWFYVDKTLTKALVQSMGNKQEYDTWSEKITGIANITTMFRDDVSYMDKFEIIDLESTFTQTLKPVYNSATDTLFSFVFYDILSVLNIYKFQASHLPLIPLKSKDEEEVNWDYELSGNKILLNPDRHHQDYEDGKLSITIRYRHTPVYCIVDIQREIFKAKDKTPCSTNDCNIDNKNLDLKGQPQKSVGRRLHYVWDANNFNEPSVFDNTIY